MDGSNVFLSNFDGFKNIPEYFIYFNLKYSLPQRIN